jgi:ArsR family transcriptional regulator
MNTTEHKSGRGSSAEGIMNISNIDNIRYKRYTAAMNDPTAHPQAEVETVAGRSCCGSGAETPFEADRLSALADGLNLLGNPIRARILELLAQGPDEVCVCDLEAALPVKQPTVSHHLRILRDAGLVGYNKRGQWAHYFLHREAMADLAARTRTWLESLA